MSWGSMGAPRISRRHALRLLGAHLPLALAACSRPDRAILPYVEMPEDVKPGETAHYASVLPLSGFGRGVLVSCVEGRPIKIEGNPRHPASLGATDVFAQAAVLSLYDPDRSRIPLIAQGPASWQGVRAELDPQLENLRRRQGRGLCLLTPRLASPTWARQIAQFLKTHPQTRWFAYDPLDQDAAMSGCVMAYGRRLVSVPDFAQADVIVSLDADFLGPGPDQPRRMRGFAERRTNKAKGAPRLFVVETTPSQTGAKADQRLARAPEYAAEAVIELANGFGAGLRPAELDEETKAFCANALQMMQKPGQRSIVLAGSSLPAEHHACVHWINARLAAPLALRSPPDLVPDHEPQSIADLAATLDAGDVELLAALGVNPAFDLAGSLNLAARLGRAQLLHAGIYPDETARLARWHLPLSHPLECWSDLRALEGTAAIAQPAIRPLYDTRSLHEVLALLKGASDASDYELVRATWPGAKQEIWWSSVLRAGTIPDTTPEDLTLPPPGLPQIPTASTVKGLTLVLQPDPCVHDGGFANNAWLQELPKPMSKQVWGHALMLAPADAKARGLSSGDLVTITVGGRSIDCPVHPLAGHAKGAASLSVGYGRDRAGSIGSGIGANGYALQAKTGEWRLINIDLRPTGRREELLMALRPVGPHDLDHATLKKRFPIVPGAEGHPAEPERDASLYPQRPLPAADRAWAMVIDTSRCTGCNACVVACQAENNIPVVGPEQIDIGRQMHWLRIDLYAQGSSDEPVFGFQPVPCMHCEKAPCEPVCPVEASVHDGEGLNVQVYNRCIGTRFCEANCPYKVRRFNFRAYADGQEYASMGAHSYKAQRNPDVSVRTRGVMEKCTYCIQRISAARHRSERDDTPVGVDEVITACQGACPARAISFGDLNQPDSEVAALRRDPRHYSLMGELGTRPRTTYLAEIRDTDAHKTGGRE